MTDQKCPDQVDYPDKPPLCDLNRNKPCMFAILYDCPLYRELLDEIRKEETSGSQP